MVKKLEKIIQNVYHISYYLNCKYLLQKFINAFSYDVTPRDVIVCQLPQKSNGRKVLNLFCFIHVQYIKTS